MKQEIKDKIINHEFPLLPEDWEKMQQRLNDGKDENPKPIARFLTFKTIIVMSIITFLIFAFWQMVQPEKVQTPVNEPVVRVLNLETKHDESPQPLKGSALSEQNSEVNNSKKLKNSAASTNNSNLLTVLPFRGRGFGRGLDSSSNKDTLPLLKTTKNTKKSPSRLFPLWGLGGEKAYLHLDRSLYKPDEDVWFAMYLRDATTLQPSQQSQILYVDLLAPNGNVQESKTYLVFDGVAAGDFHLPSTLKGGIYKIRAYTNWMKNTNDAFEREITLQAVVLPNLRMQLEFERKAYGAGDEVVAKFDVNSLENKPLRNQKVDFAVSLAGNNLLNGTAETNAEGRAWIKFRLPKDLQSNDGLLNVTLPYNGQTEAISRAVPIVLNKIDLQFLPEGGELLAGFDNNLAFKAVNEFGKPADIQGIVKNSKGETVANFKSFHDGMGAFGFQPKQGENYTAHITQPENIAATYDIVAKQNQGAVLLAKTMKDKIEVRIGANDAAFQKAYVVLQMGDKILFEQAIESENNAMGKLAIATKDFPMGIARLTLFDQNGTPRNERLVFLNRHKSLNINIKTDKAQYNPREKVSMKINVSDDKGQPVKGNFSLAVADDAQLTFANDKQGHILASLLLESELKGKIEEPNFYFDTKETKSLEALDYLMLTQGWRKFEWKDVGKEKEIVESYKFKNENATIKGYVVDAESKNRIGKLKIELLPDNIVTYSNENGEYEFKNVDLTAAKQIIYLNKIINIYAYQNDLILNINEPSYNYSLSYLGNNGGSDATLTGKITEGRSGDDAINAYVKLSKNGVIKTTVATDFEGNYSANVEEGIYDVEISYVGMQTQFIRGVILNWGRITKLDARLIDNSQVLDAVVIKEYKVPLVQQDNTTAGGTLTSDQIKNMPTRNVTALVGLTSGVSSNRDGDIQIKGTRKEGTVYIVDGVRVQASSGLPPAQEIEQLDDFINIGTPAAFEEANEESKRYNSLRIKKAAGRGNGSGSGASNGAGSGGGTRYRVGTDVGGGISNRGKIGSSPIPRNYNENADVVVDICLNADGTVDANQVKVRNKGTNTTNINLRNLAVANARTYRFNKGDDKQCGTITYHFRVDGILANQDNIEVIEQGKERRNYATTRTFYAPTYSPKDKVEVRNDFRTTIFWKPDVTTDDKGEATIEFYNSDALTTFRATLEGIGETGNIGRGEQRYATGMMLNLSAKMPDKVLTGDVVKIPLSLKNNSENAREIDLKVSNPSHFEAVGEIPTQVTLAANEAKTLFLSYKVATQSAKILGESQTFLIEAQSDDWSDKFVAQVKTLPRGFPVTQIFSANKLQNTFDLTLRQPVEKTAKLTLTAYPNPLDDILQGMERMLRQPSGCFEQVSSLNYPNLLVLDLLRNTQQNRPDVEKRALEYLADGYKKLTAYECKSGGFDWWGRDPAHEGLTAYGILEFTDMARVFDVDKTMIDRSVKWLLSRKNGKGGWTLNLQASHGWQNDAVLDAYICYALAEAGYGKEISSEIEQIYTHAYEHGASSKLAPCSYTQALLANTFLAMDDKNRAKSLINNILQQQMKDGSFEGKTHSVFHSYGKGFTIETTALVALALMKMGDNENILAKAINYIVQSKSEYGYGNTQSTVMALKALCNYARLQKQDAADGTIAIYVNDKMVAKKPYSKSQLGKLQIADLEQFISDEKQQIKVVFEGTDKAIPFDLELKYASKMPQNAAESPLKFATILAQSQTKIGDVVRLSANLENKTNQAVASPIMLIGIPAGLTAQPWQLKQIVERKECAFYEIFNNYVVFYFDELAPKSLKIINLDLRADIGGSYESPASAAYPYYTNEWRVWSKPEGILVE